VSPYLLGTSPPITACFTAFSSSPIATVVVTDHNVLCKLSFVIYNIGIGLHSPLCANILDS